MIRYVLSLRTDEKHLKLKTTFKLLIEILKIKKVLTKILNDDKI